MRLGFNEQIKENISINFSLKERYISLFSIVKTLNTPPENFYTLKLNEVTDGFGAEKSLPQLQCSLDVSFNAIKIQ